MELNFEKNGDMFVAEFVATSDFNLHIEKPTGAIYLFVKSVGNGKYDSVNVNIPAGDSVIDYDFIASVYPKYLKVVSEVEPSYAEVVSSGEVTEIKSQSKEVEIVSNGTTEVTPDAGYSYLSGVTVKVNVPQEGGGGGSAKVRYFNIKPLIDMDLTQASQLLKRFPGLLAVKAEGTYASIAPFAAFNSAYYDEINSAAILDNFRGFIENANDLNSSDLIPQLLQLGCTEITEEEFYNTTA